MQRIIDNLTAQHRELSRTGTALFGWLDAGKIQRLGASEPFRVLSSLTGILRVHLAMEDRSLYPNLLGHREAKIRTLAERFLVERGQIQERFEAYRATWPTVASVERDAARFVDETRTMLGALLTRMQQEDRMFHPEVVRAALAAG